MIYLKNHPMQEVKQFVQMSIERYDELRLIEKAFNENWKFICCNHYGTIIGKISEDEIIKTMSDQIQELSVQVQELQIKKSSWF